MESTDIDKAEEGAEVSINLQVFTITFRVIYVIVC